MKHEEERAIKKTVKCRLTLNEKMKSCPAMVSSRAGASIAAISISQPQHHIIKKDLLGLLLRSSCTLEVLPWQI
jgi:hypothetical protein